MAKKWSASAATALASQLAALDILNPPQQANVAENEQQDFTDSSPESAHLPLFETRHNSGSAADKPLEAARVSEEMSSTTIF
jgi:hypothetical protein